MPVVLLTCALCLVSTRVGQTSSVNFVNWLLSCYAAEAPFSMTSLCVYLSLYPDTLTCVACLLQAAAEAQAVQDRASHQQHMDQADVAHLNELAELRDRFVQLQSKDSHSPEELAELDALRNQVLQYQVHALITCPDCQLQLLLIALRQQDPHVKHRNSLLCYKKSKTTLASAYPSCDTACQASQCRAWCCCQCKHA